MTIQTTTLNGVDLVRVAETVAAIREEPSRAVFRFRAHNRWVAGGENRSTVFDYEGLGGEGRTHPVPFEFTSAEPDELSGNSESASAVEFLLHSLAGSLVTTFVYRAAALGVAIDSLFTEVEGEIDVRGMLGMDDAPESGYERIRVGLDVRANCPDEIVAEIAEFARTHSPVCNTIMRAVDVRIERA